MNLQNHISLALAHIHFVLLGWIKGDFRIRASWMLCIAILMVTGLTEIPGQNFTIYHSWDFERELLGPYDEEDIEEDFDIVSNYHHHSGSIVVDTINGDATKVLKITHEANKTSVGFDLDAKIVQDFNEIYLSYNFKFSEEFNSTSGGKLPGLAGFPLVTADQCPDSSQGFLCKCMFKQAGSLITYHYDRTTGYCPWATEDYDYHTIYLLNGCWYTITQRVVMNTFSDGLANGDGIYEVWVDGKLVFQESNLKLMEIEHDSMKIDGINLAHFYGGEGVSYEPLDECYGYIDNCKIYMPADDPVCRHILHDPGVIIPSPDEISNRLVYFDSLRTLPGILSNIEYGAPYGGCRDETYLIDAGEGRIVTFVLENYSFSNRGDYLFFYDGNTTDAPIVKMFQGSSGNNKVLRSTGRYLFIRFSTDYDKAGSGWTGSVSFEEKPTHVSTCQSGKNSDNKSSIFPVPVKDYFVIHGLAGQSDLTILSINGIPLYNRGNVHSGEQIDMRNLPAGLYAIVLNGDQSERHMFIKNE